MWNFIVQASGVLATIVLAVSYVPQIIALHKSKNASGISMNFWLILDLSLIMLFILAIDSFLNTGSYSLLVAQGLNLFLALVVTVQVFMYKKGDE